MADVFVVHVNALAQPSRIVAIGTIWIDANDYAKFARSRIIKHLGNLVRGRWEALPVQAMVQPDGRARVARWGLRIDGHVVSEHAMDRYVTIDRYPLDAYFPKAVDDV